ncbi:DUF6056 family protein [Lachnospiraceae bacterium ZAX-1]
MKALKGDNPYKKWEIILIFVFIAIAYVICNFILMTDGDDAYFYEMAHSMGFFEYLKMRYITWEGRMTSEAMTYISCYFGKSFWEIANAVMLALLPIGIMRLAKKMLPKLLPLKQFYLFLATYVGISFMGIDVIGYSAFWITGSTFYLWSVVAGLWAAMPLADLVFCPQDLAGQRSNKSFLYAIPCGFIASMGLEQIAAIVIMFGILAICYHYRQEKKIAWLHLLLVAIMVAGLALLFISPGTAARSQSEIETWMPQFVAMPIGNHIFITAQWLLDGLANESKMYFIIIWVLLSYSLLHTPSKEEYRMQPAGKKGQNFVAPSQKIETIVTNKFSGKRSLNRCFGIVVLVFAAVAFLPYFGITVLSDMGMGTLDITQQVAQVPRPEDLTEQNRLAMVWWCVALLLTMYLLWHTMEGLRDKITAQLIMLAAIASSALMFFSPTIYASGGRVLFMMEIMFWILSVWLFGKINGQTANKLLTALFVIAGIVNFGSRISYILTFF